MSDDRDRPDHIAPLREWQHAMLSKGIPRIATPPNKKAGLRRRWAVRIARWRFVVGCWVAGCDLGDW